MWSRARQRLRTTEGSKTPLLVRVHSSKGSSGSPRRNQARAKLRPPRGQGQAAQRRWVRTPTRPPCMLLHRPAAGGQCGHVPRAASAGCSGGNCRGGPAGGDRAGGGAAAGRREVRTAPRAASSSPASVPGPRRRGGGLRAAARTRGGDCQPAGRPAREGGGTLTASREAKGSAARDARLQNKRARRRLNPARAGPERR